MIYYIYIKSLFEIRNYKEPKLVHYRNSHGLYGENGMYYGEYVSANIRVMRRNERESETERFTYKCAYMTGLARICYHIHTGCFVPR